MFWSAHEQFMSTCRQVNNIIRYNSTCHAMSIHFHCDYMTDISSRGPCARFIRRTLNNITMCDIITIIITTIEDILRRRREKLIRRRRRRRLRYQQLRC